MADVTASRTLVKSHPELWTECSDAGTLARHLDRFGEIKITRLEPETAVAWEGEHASGTVRLEPSGWGTRVVLTATPVDEPEPMPVVEPAPVAVDDPEPVAAVAVAPVVPVVPVAPGAPEPGPASRPGFLRRLLGRFGAGARRPEVPAALPARPPVAAAPPETPLPVAAAPPETPHVDEAAAGLRAALDSLGQAHHRPFSRS